MRTMFQKMNAKILGKDAAIKQKKAMRNGQLTYEGHDHAGHDHDHGVQLPEGLSDEDIREIQQALMAGLDKLKAEFEGIQE